VLKGKGRFSKHIGLPPGSILYMGQKPEIEPEISYFYYDQEKFQEIKKYSLEELEKLDISSGMHWINIDGIHAEEVIEKIGHKFNFHQLMMEDIVHTGQRPKFEEFDDCFFLILKMLYNSTQGEYIEEEQVSIIFGENYVISFQEKPGDVFDVIRNRIRDTKYRIRRNGSDYLTYSLLDAIIDNYYIILESLGDDVEQLENEVFSNSSSSTIEKIYKMKRKIIQLRKSIWPLREVVSSLTRTENDLLKAGNLRFFSDLYDHIIMLIDTIESFREMVSGLLDIYLSSISNKMNEVMKVLTIIATIFIPLTFIAGVYGMNFQYMPELDWHWAYFAVLGVMVIVAVVMIIFFKRRKWL